MRRLHEEIKSTCKAEKGFTGILFTLDMSEYAYILL
jgi:hypothetical protein